MGEFFKGWQRKTGLVTLAMALVLAVGWMRSSVYSDELHFGIINSRSRNIFTTVDSGVRWERPTERQTANLDIPRPWILKWNSRIARKNRVHPSRESTPWRFEWGGFYFGAPLSGDRHEIWIIPYWSIILPLTLLSAWLILGKPRKRA